MAGLLRTSPAGASHRGRATAAAAAASLAGLSGVAVLAAAVLAARVLAAERRAVEDPATGVSADPPRPTVVFGSRAFPGRPGLELQARLDHAHALWRSGAGWPVVVTGGSDGTVDEAVEMRRYLVRRGIPPEAVIEARPGQNTRASIDAVTRMQSRLGPPPWIAVSTPFHAHRIATEFRRHGVSVIVSGPPGSPETRDARMHRVRLATELVASAAYALPRQWLAQVDTAPGSWRHTLPRLLAGRGRQGRRRHEPGGLEPHSRRGPLRSISSAGPAGCGRRLRVVSRARRCCSS